MNRVESLSPACLLATVLATLFSAGATSSHETPEPILVSGPSGGCYAKSVPPDARGSGAGTQTYRLGIPQDQPLYRFDWYSRYLAVTCYVEGLRGRSTISLVRMGRGWKAESADPPRSVTLAFYLENRLLAEYSRLDIARLPGTYRIGPADSWRGYYRPLGNRRTGSGSSRFDICTLGGVILTFDLSNGSLTNHHSAYPHEGCKRHNPREGEQYREALPAYY